MKKRIVALLLAGLITTSLASCVVQGNNNQQNGTTPDQQTTTDPNHNVQPPEQVWNDADKSVFTLSDVKLRQEANTLGTALVTIPKETELHCTKASLSWYYVEYGEYKGYVSKTQVTEVDILGKYFTEVEGGEQVMYANANINIRLYPSEAEFSTKVGGYSLNDEVTVVASNGTWYKIKYVKDGVEKNYYVHASCLAEGKVTDPNDDKPYADLFTEVPGTPTKYVSVEGGGKVNFRVAPSTDKNTTIIMSLSDGCPVIVLKTGIVNEAAWSYVAVLVTSDKEGVPDEYKYGYISSDFLSETSGEMSVDELLALYPTLTKIEGGKTYYVLKEATITIRRTPKFPADGEESNSLSNPQSGKTPETVKAIKVLATGEIDGTNWFFVEYVKKDGENETLIRGFVGGKALEYLTTDANGNPTVTLEDLIIKYPQFSKLETPTNITTKSVANCYGTPDASGEVLGQLEADMQVKLVAKEEGALTTWYVIETEDGKLFFVGKQFFN